MSQYLALGVNRLPYKARGFSDGAPNARCAEIRGVGNYWLDGASRASSRVRLKVRRGGRCGIAGGFWCGPLNATTRGRRGNSGDVRGFGPPPRNPSSTIPIWNRDRRPIGAEEMRIPFRPNARLYGRIRASLSSSYESAVHPGGDSAAVGVLAGVDSGKGDGRIPEPNPRRP